MDHGSESVFKRSRNSNNVRPVQPNMLEVDIEALASVLFPDSRPPQGRTSANGFELIFSFSLNTYSTPDGSTCGLYRIVQIPWAALELHHVLQLTMTLIYS